MLLISEDFVIYFILFIAEKLGDITPSFLKKLIGIMTPLRHGTVSEP